MPVATLSYRRLLRSPFRYECICRSTPQQKDQVTIRDDMRAIRWHLRVLPIVILMKNTWAHQADAPKRVHAGGAGNEVNLILSQCLWETYIMLQTWSSHHGYCVFGGVKNTAALEYWPTPPQVGFTAGTGPHLIAESRCCRRTGTLISLLDRSTRETEMLFLFGCRLFSWSAIIIESRLTSMNLSSCS